MSKRIFYWGPFIVFVAACLIRIPFLSSGPGGWDDVDFALALARYDLAEMQPHFPGYPIYLLVATGISAFIPNGFSALSWLSLEAASLSVIPIYALIKKVSGRQTAIWVSLFWAVAPLSLVLGTQPLSDSFGTMIALCVAASSMAALDRQRPEPRRAFALLMSGIFLGLLYGVRLSYLPLGAIPLWAGCVYFRDTRNWRDVLQAVFCALLVSASWVIALAWNVGGFDMLWTLATGFTAGHFSDWGGTYHEGSSLTDRAAYMIGRQLFAAGIGTPWSGQSPISYLVLVLALLALTGWILKIKETSLREKGREWGLLAAWIVPYLLWSLFAQNIEKPRHLLPLLPPVLWVLVAGLAYWRRFANGLLPLFLLSMLAVGVAQLQGQSITPSPMVQLSDYLDSHIEKTASLVFTYEEERVIKYKHPSIPAMRVRKFSDFQISLLNYPVLPKHIYLTDSVLEGFQMPNLQGFVREVARFSGSEWLYPTYHDIVLYEIIPEKTSELVRLSPLPKRSN